MVLGSVSVVEVCGYELIECVVVFEGEVVVEIDGDWLVLV